MKSRVSILTLLLVGLGLAAWTCNAIAATATGSVTYDFTVDPNCTTTVTTDCIDHFEIWDVTGAAKKLATVPLPSPINSTVPFTFKIGPPYGNRTWAALAVAKDGTTSSITAVQAQATVTVRPGVPASVIFNLN